MKLRYSSQTKKGVIERRRQGVSLQGLVTEFNIPKSTIQGWVSRVRMPPELREKMLLRASKNRQVALSRRRIKLPNSILEQLYSLEFIRFFAHCLFDGSVFRDQVVYYSSHLKLAQQFANDGQKLFGLVPHWYKTKFHIYRVHFYSKNLVDHLNKSKSSFLEGILKQELDCQIVFLKAFFDDEGSVTYRPKTSKRSVRGYQKDVGILRLISLMLGHLGIDSVLENVNRYPEIAIRGRVNIENFARLINFSHGVSFLATRKNSYYSRPIEKQKVLQALLASYVKN